MPIIQPLTPEILEKRRTRRRKIIGAPGRIWRKTRRGIGWTLALLFVAHAGLNIYSSVLLGRELSAIRSKGEPLTFAEMAPPAVPDSQNAALVYRAATQALHLTREEEEAVGTRQKERTPQQKKTVEAVFRKSQQALTLTRSAAAMPQCRFPLINYTTKNPATITFPYYAEMRALARLMRAQAEIEAQEGDSAAALRDVRAVFAMANHLSNEPVLIGSLVAQAVDSLANQSLSDVLEIMPVTQAQTGAFQKSIPSTDWNASYKHSLLGERAWSIFAFESSRQPDGLTIAELNGLTGGEENSRIGLTARVWFAVPSKLLWRPISKMDEVQNLRLWKKLFVINSKNQFSHDNPLSDPINQAINNVPNYAVLTRILFPVFARANINRDRVEVRRRERVIALSLAVYRTTNGHYPARLSDLVSVGKNPLPLDPYGRRPFVYRLDKDGKGFLLYSIGPNWKDDGGAIYSSAGTNWNNDDNDDIIWGNLRR